MKLNLRICILWLLLLSSTVFAEPFGGGSIFNNNGPEPFGSGGGGSGGYPPASPNGSVQINNKGAFGPLTIDTLAAYAAHNVAASGTSYDPRDPAYGAICAGYNTFAGDGSTTTFTYTIPFSGTSPTDNTNFMVFYEPTNGFGSSVILNTSQFTVTGVNSGSGGTITLTTAPPSGDVLIVVHDDAPGLVAASTAAASTGGNIDLPDDCTIYGSALTGTQLAEGAQIIGHGFTPNYGFQAQGIKPYVRVIAPTGYAPAFGFNISGKNQQFYEGFTITSNVPGYNSLGFLDVPVLIGANGSSGAGGGQSPGIVVQYLTFNSGSVGFGAPIGGNAGYIFAVARYNNFSANNAGIYGPLSDAQVYGNDFVSNGAFGSYGSAGGMVIGPQEGAPGASSAGRVATNRFEFNLEGVVIQSGAVINFAENQFDGNTGCGLDLNTYWSQINITGGWFRGNGNGGGPNYTGNTTAGEDADICFNSGTGSGGLFMENVQFLTNYGEGNTAPLGSDNATTPPYVFDFNSVPANNTNIVIKGNAATAANASGSYVTDLAIYRDGRPPDLKMNIAGQATQGNIANGSFSSQARGLPSNSWSGLDIIGDASSYNTQYLPLTNGYGAIIGKQIGTGPTYLVNDSFSIFDCDVVDSEIAPNVNPTLQGNPVIAWLPSPSDVTFGGGFYSSHEADTNSCRMGALTWMAVPRDYKVYGQQGTTTGTWANDASYGGTYGVVSDTNASTLALPITSNGGPIYLWYRMNGSNGGTFTYQLDSGPTTSVATQGNNTFTYPIDNTHFTLGGIRIPVLAMGSHTIHIAVTSTTSASNTVIIEGIGTTPGLPLSGTSPTVYLAGQVYENDSYPAAIAAFNSDQLTQANQLFADGLSVNFVNVENYFNFSTDISYTHINAMGQKHIAQAFNAIIQGAWNAMNAINPIDFGASCNSLYFANAYSTTSYSLSTTANSPVISISGYSFQPGVATQFGGGDVGKMICIGPGSGGSPPYQEIGCTYIASVNTSNNTATMGISAINSSSAHYAVMGGYPTNPNDPSTAQDDTAAFQAAGAAALVGGGKVFMPNNCMVHNLNMPENIVLEGDSPGDFYLQTQQDISLNQQATILNCAISGIPGNDAQQCIQAVPHTQYKNFMMRAPTFPYTPYGLSAACLGYSTSGGGPNSQVLTENLSFFGCPVDIGQAYGYNHEVDFTGSMTGNILTVTAINSTNFNTADGWSTFDFLNIGRSITGSGVPSNTTILTAPPSGGTGAYTVSTSATFSSESLVSPNNGQGMELRDTKSQHVVAGIGYNGDFSDSVISNSTCTGTFMSVCWRLGPSVAGFGAAGNRWLGGRMEEMNNGIAAGITCDGCGVYTEGLDFDFNGGYNIRTLGSSPNVQVTGGQMQAGGHCAGFHNSMIRLGGSNPIVSVDGVALSAADFGSGCGGSTNYLFATETGSTLTSAFAAVTGGATLQASGNVITGLYDWTNGAISAYKQDTGGWPVIDNTVRFTASGCSNTSPVGSAKSGQVTAGASGTCTLTLTMPVSSAIWNCYGGDQTTHTLFAQSASSVTACSLTGTAVSGDTLWFITVPF